MVWSGGQTGADRAALDIAIQFNIPHKGFCPKGRLAEDGKVPDKYELKESYSPGYEKRTELNVLYTDATVLFCFEQTPGSRLTIKYCEMYKKPYLYVNLNNFDISKIREFIKTYGWINFAGTRESKAPGIYKKVYNILKEVLEPTYINENDLD